MLPSSGPCANGLGGKCMDVDGVGVCHHVKWLMGFWAKRHT